VCLFLSSFLYLHKLVLLFFFYGNGKRFVGGRLGNDADKRSSSCDVRAFAGLSGIDNGHGDTDTDVIQVGGRRPARLLAVR